MFTDPLSDIITALLITLALGAFIGLQFRKNAEEEGYQEKAFAGMRTCMALALIGYLSVYISEYIGSAFILITSFVFLLIILGYIYNTFKEDRPGATSEIIHATIYLVGVLVAIGKINLAIIITIFLSIIASGREHLYGISAKCTRYLLFRCRRSRFEYRP